MIGLPQLHAPCPCPREEGRGRGVPATTSLSIRKAENSPQAPEQATPTLTGQNWVAKETRTDTTDLHQYDSSQGPGRLSQQGRPRLCEVGGRRTDIDRSPGLAPQMQVPDMLQKVSMFGSEPAPRHLRAGRRRGVLEKERGLF